MTNVSAIAIHGIYTHHIYYAELAKYYLSRGIAVTSFDLMGFGHTTEKNRGDIESFHEYIFETVNVVLETKKRNPGHKVVVIGENIGGLVALMTAVKTQNQIDALIVMNPVTDPRFPLAKMKRLNLFFASPDQRVDLPAAPADYCDEEKALEILKKDDYRAKSVTVRFLRAMTAAASELGKNAQKIVTPVLIQVSKNDPTGNSAATRNAIFQIPSRQKHYQIIDCPENMTICRDRDPVFEKQIKFLSLVFPDNA